jgi:hypothetical protein
MIVQPENEFMGCKYGPDEDCPIYFEIAEKKALDSAKKQYSPKPLSLDEMRENIRNDFEQHVDLNLPFPIEFVEARLNYIMEVIKKAIEDNNKGMVAYIPTDNQNPSAGTNLAHHDKRIGWVEPRRFKDYDEYLKFLREEREINE